MPTEETKFLIIKGKMLLPAEGAWISLIGNHFAPRGGRLPMSFARLDIRHLDIYWAYNEETPFKINNGFFGKHIELTSENLENYDADDFIEELLTDNGGYRPLHDDQLTWMTLHTPNSQLVRVWRGEVAVFTEELIGLLLADDCLDVRIFGLGNPQDNPIWDEATRDIIGSLMLDGLSYNEAQRELVVVGELKTMDYKLPNHFYRPQSWYRNQFCEEE